MSFESTAWIALDDVVEEIIDRRGVTPLKLGGDFVTEGHRVISAKLLKDRTVQLEADEARYVNSEIYKKWMKVPLRAGDVIMTSEAPLGELAYLHEDKDWVLGQRLFAIRPRKEIMNGRFLYYVLQTGAVRSDIQGRATGTTVQGIRQAELRLVKVPVPSLAEQNEAASFLGALDDRITLLRETNKTLEAIAQAIFKSWFIDFDPVRAKMEGRAPAGMDEETAAMFPDELVESELGLVPKGWRHCSLRDVVDIFDSKRIPLSGAERSTRKGSFPYYGAASLMDHVDDYLFDGVHLLIGEDGTVTDSHGYPVTQYVWGKFWVNNHAHILQGKSGISTEHVMLSLKRTNIQALVTGAVQAKLSQSNMWKINFLNPTGKIAEIFGQILDPLYKRYRHNVEMERTLEGLRDTLLPRLISGRLRAQVDPNAEVV